MTKEKKKFLKILKKSFRLAPQLRITQTLYNLGFSEKEVQDGDDKHYFKDNYNQSDETTIKKVKEGFKKLFKSAFKGIKSGQQEDIDQTYEAKDCEVQTTQSEAVE